MKRKTIIQFLFVSLFLFSTNLIWAQSSSVVEGATDQQWLRFMADNAFGMQGLDYKMPLLASELNLNDREQHEVRVLFLDYNNADNPTDKTMEQVRKVRDLLGSRDLDFRFWFFEEAMISDAENRAYHENHHYSADDLAQSIVASVQQTQEFKEFHARKIEWLNSDATNEKAEDYFSNWQTLLANRVLVQIKQVKRRNLIDG